jgi:hypothetical protein
MKEKNTLSITALALFVCGCGMVNVEVNPPKPVVTTERADEANSSILKEKETVYATIQNNGGAGNVLVTFHISQGGYNYDRSQSIQMTANQSSNVQETFDEVHRLDGAVTYSVDVKAE